MKSLQGYLRTTDLQIVREKTKLIFRDYTQFITPEAYIVHEQNLLADDELLRVCCEECKEELQTPKKEYIPHAMLEKFRGTNCVPIKYSAQTNTMTVGVLPELRSMCDNISNIYIHEVKIPIYYYIDRYLDYYGAPDFLLPLPTADYLDFIYTEALALKAAEITICNNTHKTAQAFYNVRKRIVHSRRKLDGDTVLSLALMLASKAGATFDPANEDPRYFSIHVDMHTRGRVTVNKTYHGWCITIRLFPDDYLETTLEQLNLSQATCGFIRDVVLSDEKGLRLFIGETMSGKNTSILASLLELVALDRYKIVSVENPVEILVQGVIQISTETEEAFAKVADSLLRQNPDIVYFTEITEKTAYSILKQANTSKAIYSTVHANSIAEVISRLMDITGLDSDRVVQSLQSCVYQVLERDDEKDIIYPVNRCVHFDDKLKARLYGKPLHEKHSIIKEVEDVWVS